MPLTKLRPTFTFESDCLATLRSSRALKTYGINIATQPGLKERNIARFVRRLR